MSASRLIGYRAEPVHAESLASIHDWFLPRSPWPAAARVLDLSSVRQPIEAVGRAVIRALLDHLPGASPASDLTAPEATGTGLGRHGPEPTGRLIAPALVVRASSAAPIVS